MAAVDLERLALRYLPMIEEMYASKKDTEITLPFAGGLARIVRRDGEIQLEIPITNEPLHADQNIALAHRKGDKYVFPGDAWGLNALGLARFFVNLTSPERD